MDFVMQLVVVVGLAVSVLTLFLKLRGIERDIEKSIDKHCDRRIRVLEKVQAEKDKLTENKYDTLWHKVNSLDTQINGNPETDKKGLIITVELIRMLLKKDES